MSHEGCYPLCRDLWDRQPIEGIKGAPYGSLSTMWCLPSSNLRSGCLACGISMESDCQRPDGQFFFRLLSLYISSHIVSLKLRCRQLGSLADGGAYS